MTRSFVPSGFHTWTSYSPNCQFANTRPSGAMSQFTHHPRESPSSMTVSERRHSVVSVMYRAVSTPVSFTRTRWVDRVMPSSLNAFSPMVRTTWPARIRPPPKETEPAVLRRRHRVLTGRVAVHREEDDLARGHLHDGDVAVGG